MTIRTASLAAFAALSLAVAALTPGAFAAVDMFMKIEGIDGESRDHRHPDWIDILSVAENVSMTVSLGGTGGHTGGQADFQDLTITKYIDLSSVPIRDKLARGSHIQRVEIEIMRPTAHGSSCEDPIFKFDMEDVLITSVSLSGSTAEDRPVEEMSMNFRKIRWRYVPITATGACGSAIEKGWDREANQPL